MKKIFSKIRGKSPAKGAPPSPGSSRSGHAIVVGYDIKDKDLKKIHKAAWNGDRAKVKQLAPKEGPSPLDKENRTPLHLACVKGHTDIVQELLEWKAKPNIGDNQQKTPLIKAVQCHREDCVQLLIESHADLDTRDVDGNAALHYAVQDGELDILQMLANGGAELNVKNKADLTPLHLAVGLVKPNIAELLLQEGADINANDNSTKTTPLMIACQDGNEAFIKLLVDYNADQSLKNTNDWRAEDFVVIKNLSGCVEILHQTTSSQKSGSTPSIPSTPQHANVRQEFGIPAIDNGDDESDEETVSRASGTGAGYTSWGDDTDISLAVDDKPKERADIEHITEIPELEYEDSDSDVETAGKLSLAKFIKPSDEEEESVSTRIPRLSQPMGATRSPPGRSPNDENPGSRIPVKRRSVQSASSVEEDSWGTSESPVTPRKPRLRVSFKGGEEISEVKDMSDEDPQQNKSPMKFSSFGKQSDSEAREGRVTVKLTSPMKLTTPVKLTPPVKLPRSEGAAGYTPSGSLNGGPAMQMTPDRRKADKDQNGAYMTDLGFGDADEVSDADASEFSGAEALPKSFNGDSTIQSQPQMPRNGATNSRPNVVPLANVDEIDGFGNEEERPGSASPRKNGATAETPREHSEWDSTMDQESRPKERRTPRTDASEWDSDVEDTLHPNSGVKEEGETGVDTSPKADKIGMYADLSEDVQTHEDSEQSSDWDSTVDAVTPRHLTNLEDELPADNTPPMAHVAHTTSASPDMVPVSNGGQQDSDDQWDSEDDELPSNASPAKTLTITMNGVTASVRDSEEEETISEWEIELKKEKAKKLLAAVQPTVEENNAGDISIEAHEIEKNWIRDYKEEVEINERVFGNQNGKVVSEDEEEVSEDDDSDSDEEAQRLEAKWAQLEEVASQIPTKTLQDRQKELEEEQKDRDAEKLREEELECKEEDRKKKEAEDREERERRVAILHKKLVDEAKAEEERKTNEARAEEERKKREEQKRKDMEEEMQRQMEEGARLEAERQEKWAVDEQRRREQLKQLAEEELRKEREQIEKDRKAEEEECVVPVAVDTVDMGIQEKEKIKEVVPSQKAHLATTNPESDTDEGDAKQHGAFQVLKTLQKRQPPVSTQRMKPYVGLKSNNPVMSKPAEVIPPKADNAMTEDEDLSMSSDNVMDDDLLEENVGQTHDMTKYLASLVDTPMYSLDIAARDDDGLSYTSTENDTSMILPANTTPYSRDTLANLNLSEDSISGDAEEFDNGDVHSDLKAVPTIVMTHDQQSKYAALEVNLLKRLTNVKYATAVIKLQEHMRDSARVLDHERSQRLLLENRQRAFHAEKADLQKKIELLMQQRSGLEQERIELDAKIRALEYNLAEESEQRKNADILLDKTKEQLERKDRQYVSEIEARQKTEVALRNIHMELAMANSTMKDLEEEREDLLTKYSHEKAARQIQEQVNEEQRRLHQRLQEGHDNTLLQADATSQLETVDEDGKLGLDPADREKLKAEVHAMRVDAEHQRNRYKDEVERLTADLDSKKAKVDGLKNEVKLRDEALAETTMQYKVQISSLVADRSLLLSSVDQEKAGREKLEAELESYKIRLQAAVSEMERLQQIRNELERTRQRDSEDWQRQIANKEQEMKDAKESSQTASQQLNLTQNKLNSVENEYHICSTSLMERTNQLTQVKQSMEQMKLGQDSTEEKYSKEKEQNSKLQTKADSLQDKVSGMQHENLSLTQQLTTAQQSLLDRSGQDSQEKFAAMLADLRSDQDKSRATLEEKNTSMNDMMSRLKEELRTSDNRRVAMEQDLRRLNQDQSDITRKLYMAETSLEVTIKAKDALEQEKGQLRLDAERMQQKYQTAYEKNIESQARIAELAGRLERAERSNIELSSSVNSQNASYSKAQLADSVQKLQVENARMTAELKHEREKVDNLQRDLQDSQQVRNTLEALCSNQKTRLGFMEEKINDNETGDNVDDSISDVSHFVANEDNATCKALLNEAQDSKDLWEKEVLSRSKLGLRIAQLQREKQETGGSIDEERRKVQKAIEEKKHSEIKLGSEMEKNISLQKEVATLKANLKSAKKRLKELESSDARVNTMNSEFERERLTMEGTLTAARRQLDDLKDQLEDEVNEKQKLQNKNRQLNSEVGTVQNLESSLDMLERNKDRLESEFIVYKRQVEQDQMEKVKAELEARYRLELNRQLDKVNAVLAVQANEQEKVRRSRTELESKLTSEKRMLEAEIKELRLKYEQAVASRECKELESKHYRDMYDSEMKWRMRLSNQLERSTGSYKSKILHLKLSNIFWVDLNAEENNRNKLYASLGNLTGGDTCFLSDANRLNQTIHIDDRLNERMKNELDRSIAKHLEAAPHNVLQTVIRRNDDKDFFNASFAKSNAEYLSVLKRKYCV